MTGVSPGLDELRERFESLAGPGGVEWLDATIAATASDPATIRTHFAMAGRKVGRGPLDPVADAEDVHAWAVDDAARVLLLVSMGATAEPELWDLYRFGDAAERRGLLRALPYLEISDEAGLGLVDDAVRTNDTRLIAAALGRYATEHLDDAAYEQAVLKCVFVGVPIAPLDGLPERATQNGSRMLAALVVERVAAGREIPAEVWPVIYRFPPEAEIAAIEAELDSPFEDRRVAAERALAGREGVTGNTAN